MRGLQANQDYTVSLQKTHWRSSTSSREVWWLQNGRSQSRQRGWWITEQSMVRCRCSRSCHWMDSILSVQNQNFAGDGKEFTKVCRQFIWTWANLVMIYHESSNLNTSKGRVLYCYDQDWMENGGLIPWNAIAICEMSKTSWHKGKHHMKDDLENHSKGQ